MRISPALSSVVASRPSVAGKTFNYSFASGKPVGMTEDASRAEMVPLTISGGTRLQEANATGSSVPAFWFAGGPTAMDTMHYRATMIVGNQSSGTNRGAMVWVGGNDGAGGPGILNSVWFRIRGQSTPMMIGTKQGTSVLDRQSGANGLVAPNDTIGLDITETAPGSGIYTYQGYKNGAPVSTPWTDSGGIIVPNKGWGCGGYGVYSGSYFPSLGAYGMSCLDL